MRDLLWQEQRFWLGVDEAGTFAAAAHIHLQAVGGSLARVYIHPQARGRVVEAVIQGALRACGSSSLSMTIQVSATEERAREILRRYGFAETRNLHRLMIEV